MQKYTYPGHWAHLHVSHIYFSPSYVKSHCYSVQNTFNLIIIFNLFPSIFPIKVKTTNNKQKNRERHQGPVVFLLTVFTCFHLLLTICNVFRDLTCKTSWSQTNAAWKQKPNNKNLRLSCSNWQQKNFLKSEFYSVRIYFRNLWNIYYIKIWLWNFK